MTKIGCVQHGCADCEDLEALRLDAARYRWLRDSAQSELGSGGKFDLRKYGVISFYWERYQWTNGVCIDTLQADAAIDAAMKEGAK